MRIRVDRDKCVGHGRCYAIAPEVYSDDERGHCVPPAVAIARDLEAQARRGADNCPEHAISIDARRSASNSTDRGDPTSRS